MNEIWIITTVAGQFQVCLKVEKSSYSQRKIARNLNKHEEIPYPRISTLTQDEEVDEQCETGNKQPIFLRTRKTACFIVKKSLHAFQIVRTIAVTFPF